MFLRMLDVIKRAFTQCSARKDVVADNYQELSDGEDAVTDSEENIRTDLDGNPIMLHSSSAELNPSAESVNANAGFYPGEIEIPNTYPQDVGCPLDCLGQKQNACGPMSFEEFMS